MSSSFRLEIDTRQFERTLNEFARDAIDTAEQVLYSMASVVMTVSQADFVPVLTGNLRASGYVNQPIRSGDEIAVELGYSTNYAWARHEKPESWGQGKPKFLERAMVEVLQNADRYFTEGFRRFT